VTQWRSAAAEALALRLRGLAEGLAERDRQLRSQHQVQLSRQTEAARASGREEAAQRVLKGLAPDIREANTKLRQTEAERDSLRSKLQRVEEQAITLSRKASKQNEVALLEIALLNQQIEDKTKLYQRQRQRNVEAQQSVHDMEVEVRAAKVAASAEVQKLQQAYSELLTKHRQAQAAATHAASMPLMQVVGLAEQSLCIVHSSQVRRPFLAADLTEIYLRNACSCPDKF
jgi:chromosome segregation ATPase